LIKVLKSLFRLDVDTFLHGHGDMDTRKDMEALI